jgi:hypothetical protein
MSEFNWRAFLQQWSRDLYQRLDDEAIEQLPTEVITSLWFGFPGATERQIDSLEHRLGKTLPPSYREFLLVTNGWRQLDLSIDRMLPTDEVNWLRLTNQSLVEEWGASGPEVDDSMYYVYGAQQDPSAVRSRYLRTALEIGNGQDLAHLLLNPEVATNNGEWEAWFFATWLAGADRFRTFQDLMESLHSEFIEETDVLREISSD